MISFREFLFLTESNILNEAVNKHSTHVEELIFTKGRKGLAEAIAGLSYIIKTLGTSKINSSISTKIDGAPACFFGYSTKGFFVSTKGLFNKNPKLNYTKDDIFKNHPGGLGDTLVYCLEYLKSVTPEKVGTLYQGDILFTKKSLKSKTIDDKDCWCFHPNTIEYTVEKNTPAGSKIGSAQMGIAVHTKYKWDGIDPTTLSVSAFGISKSEFSDSSSVFLMDTHNTSANSGFSENEQKELYTKLGNLRSLCTSELDTILTDPEIGQNIMTFTNTYIRNSIIMPNPSQRKKEFIESMTTKMQAEIDSKKTDRGKETAKSKYAFLEAAKRLNLELFFQIFDIITEIKLTILNKLNSLSFFNNFVVKSNGDMEKTGEEGFVISATSAKGCKLVDRYTFSHNNFSADIIKGWSH